jgi:hypothetical protein
MDQGSFLTAFPMTIPEKRICAATAAAAPLKNREAIGLSIAPPTQRGSRE